jgi:hypothetical protein
MRASIQRPNPSQQSSSAKPMGLDRPRFGRSRDDNSIFYLQRTLGNHALQRLIEASAGNGRDDSNTISHDFSGIHILSQPAVKQPPTPKPQKGEKPLGTLKDKQTGAVENIYTSFITSGLWWFNGETPTLGNEYPTTAEIPVADFGKGDFAVKVTAGSDKVALGGGGATLTGKDLTTVTVNSRAPSTKHNDVEIEVKHQAPGAKSGTARTATFEVRAPHHLALLGTDHLANGSNGFRSWTSLQVFDNFSAPMPFIDVNEDFSAATLEKGVSSEWKDGFDARTKGSDVSRGNAVFKDQYGVAVSGTLPASMKPQVSNPGSPLSKTKTGSFTHDWYVGSATTGKGVHVSHHLGVFYSDHGEYTNFTSPPVAVKKSRK